MQNGQCTAALSLLYDVVPHSFVSCHSSTALQRGASLCRLMSQCTAALCHCSMKWRLTLSSQCTAALCHCSTTWNFTLSSRVSHGLLRGAEMNSVQDKIPIHMVKTTHHSGQSSEPIYGLSLLDVQDNIKHSHMPPTLKCLGWESEQSQSQKHHQGFVQPSGIT